MGVDYPTASQRCALCNAETDAHQLRDFMRLDCCASSIGDDLKKAIQQGAIVDLTGNSVWVHDDDVGQIYKFADMDEAMPYALALAVHIERLARG